MNKIMVTGRLIDNPTFQIDKTGRQLCRFRLAVNHGNNKTTFINVVTFRQLAERCQKILKKANKILVDGKLDYYVKDTKEYYSIQAEIIEILANIRNSNES